MTSPWLLLPVAFGLGLLVVVLVMLVVIVARGTRGAWQDVDRDGGA